MHMHSIPKALEKTGFHASDCEGPWSESERSPRSKKIMLSKSTRRDCKVLARWPDSQRMKGKPDHQNRDLDQKW
jgi:hypothetical protein